MSERIPDEQRQTTSLDGLPLEDVEKCMQLGLMFVEEIGHLKPGKGS